MPANDLALLIEAARAAGEVAKGFARSDLDIRDKGDGAGPVTAADLAVDRMLRERLTAARPGYGWLSEETADDGARLSARRLFIVDPIDGTRSFIEGSQTWAHSLAIVEDGLPIAGVVYLPALDKTYAAARGMGAALNGARIAVSGGVRLDDAQVLATRPNLDPEHWRGPVPALRREHRPSLAYRMSLVAEGRFDAMITFRPSWEWDIAAGAVILAEAGAVLSDRTGAALRFNNPDPRTQGVVAAGPALHAELIARSAHAA